MLVVLCLSMALIGCGTFTGIPSHGGGKRFAVEQELVAATARSVIKDIDLSQLKGKKTALFIVSMGDQGSGSTFGGRASLNALLRGQHVNTPNSVFPVINTTTTTGTTVTESGNVVNSPEETTGGGHSAEVGIIFNGISSYKNNEVSNPNDTRFLSAVIQEYLALQGVALTSPDNADYNIYINVDVFGTIRSRTDWLFKNNESLKAKTAIEVTVIDNKTNSVFISPQVSSYEAEYKENYFLWMGPTSTQKTLYKSDGLLTSFAED